MCGVKINKLWKISFQSITKGGNTIMKKRFFVVAMLFICILFSVSASKANAAEGWYDCNIVQIGSGWGYVSLSLTDVNGAFSVKWFYMLGSSDIGKQMLATALTTVSMGQRALIYADPVTIPVGYPGPTVAGFFLTP
jgi:hypothetical protein